MLLIGIMCDTIVSDLTVIATSEPHPLQKIEFKLRSSTYKCSDSATWGSGP